MKVYKFGCDTCVCYNIVIIEDNECIKIATVGLETVIEYLAKPVKFSNGMVRLTYNGSSSMPFKNPDGSMCEKYKLIYET